MTIKEKNIIRRLAAGETRPGDALLTPYTIYPGKAIHVFSKIVKMEDIELYAVSVDNQELAIYKFKEDSLRDTQQKPFYFWVRFGDSPECSLRDSEHVESHIRGRTFKMDRKQKIAEVLKDSV